MSKFNEILKLGMDLQYFPGRTKKAREWYRTMAALKNMKLSTLTSWTDRQRTTVEIGDMVFFLYDAKHKDKLPYWDAFPLIFPFDEGKDYFMGLNLHYLAPQQRATLMDLLYPIASDKKYDLNTKMMLSYQTITLMARSRLAQPCIKKYLKLHVRSKFVKIQLNEWDIALFLPLAKFQGATLTKVWSESARRI